jgi:protein-disulfide isomerase
MATIISGIMNFVGCILVAGAVFVLADKAPKAPYSHPKVRAVQTTPAKIGDREFAELVKKNAEVIINSVNEYYQQQQAQRRAANPPVADADMIKEIMDDKTNTVLGNPKGTFVMIEFFDYNCGYCKMMNKKMAEAIKKSDNIRWILMDTPIFGEKSEVISRYALAAGKQGKFEAFHAALADAKDKTEAGLKEIGKTVGLDVAKLEKDANSDAIKKKLTANREYTKKLQMGGVPMFIIDGQIQGGAFQDEQMNEYIKKANEMKKTSKKAKK